MTTIPKLFCDDKELLAKANKIRNRAIQNRPEIVPLLEFEDQRNAAWWVKNTNRVSRDKIWQEVIRCCEDPKAYQAKVNLILAAEGKAEEEYQAHLTKIAAIHKRMQEMYGDNYDFGASSDDEVLARGGWYGDDDRINKF